MNKRPAQPGVNISVEQLKQYELVLNPRQPEKSSIPTKVLGYGEVSTVLEIDFGTGEALAYKRMPMFKTEQEIESYIALYQEYLDTLESQVNLHILPGTILWFANEAKDRIVAYLIQEKLPSTSIGSNIIHHVSSAEAQKLILAVIQETARVFDFNEVHRGKIEVAIDGQISNWAVLNYGPGLSTPGEEIQLTYFDTNTPFILKAGKEQANPDLFLRSAPSFLVWILKLLFLKDVMTRYYDFRKVCIDLVANFYKEQRSDLIPDVVSTVNDYFSSREQTAGFRPISVKEIRDYYQEDAMIWRLYLSFRKIDRTIHNFIHKSYPYILPDKINR